MLTCQHITNLNIYIRNTTRISSVRKLENDPKNNTHLTKATNIASLIINTKLLIYQLHNVNAGIYVVLGHSRMQTTPHSNTEGT
jgi:hypothetical protein